MIERTWVLVHGAGGGAWEWNVWRAVLASAGAAVVTPELRPVAAGLAATRWTDYRAQLEAATPVDAVLVGASLGGLLALAVAACARPAAIVLVNPLPPAPWHAELPPREPWPAVVPWQATASVEGTRRALPDADDATVRYAAVRWRDESGAVLDAARQGLALPQPACPVLVLASADDVDVPASVSARYAADIGADLVRLPRTSHVGPLLGRGAAACAALAAAWVATAGPHDGPAA